MSTDADKTWSAGQLYEPYVGRWSRRAAEEFLAWLQPAANWEWLDVGCGTGALTDAILKDAHPNYVTGVDPSSGFIAYAREQLTDPRANFLVADAQALPVESSRFDAAVAGLVLNFIPEPLVALREMIRATRPGGLVAAYVWDYAGKMDLMRYFWDAAVALNPAAAQLDEGRRFPLCASDRLRELFAHAGLTEVQVRPIDIATPFRNFDDYWTPFLGGQGPAPAYAMSQSGDDRAALCHQLRATLPTAADGSIDLTARAWAIRGTHQR